MTKLQAVLAALGQFPHIAKWYAEEHGVTADQLTVASVMNYGTGGHGDIADAILAEPEAAEIQAQYEASLA